MTAGGAAASRIVLRPAEAEDRTFLVAVYAAAREHELAGLEWPAEAKAAFVEAQFAAQSRAYAGYGAGTSTEVITVDDQPAGRLVVHRAASGFRLVDLALLPAYRGQGVGSWLLGRLLAEAAALGLPVALQVERSSPALRLYLRHGFSVEDARSDAVRLELSWTPPPGVERHPRAPGDQAKTA